MTDCNDNNVHKHTSFLILISFPSCLPSLKGSDAEEVKRPSHAAEDLCCFSGKQWQVLSGVSPLCHRVGVFSANRLCSFIASCLRHRDWCGPIRRCIKALWCTPPQAPLYHPWAINNSDSRQNELGLLYQEFDKTRKKTAAAAAHELVNADKTVSPCWRSRSKRGLLHR